MRAYVFTDASLSRHAGQFVWLALDFENSRNAAVVKRLGGAKRCEKAIKDQLAEIDSLEAKVESIQLGAAGTTATARVKSTHAGKSRVSTVMLVKEGGKWKVSALQ